MSAPLGLRHTCGACGVAIHLATDPHISNYLDLERPNYLCNTCGWELLTMAADATDVYLVIEAEPC